MVFRPLARTICCTHKRRALFFFHSSAHSQKSKSGHIEKRSASTSGTQTLPATMMLTMAAIQIDIRNNTLLSLRIQTLRSMLVALLLSAALVVSIEGFAVGHGPERLRTRTLSRTSTAFNVHAPIAQAAAPLLLQLHAVPAASGTEQQQRANQRNSMSTDESTVTSSDEQEVDAYLEFLDRRYRYVSLSLMATSRFLKNCERTNPRLSH
jgi:hypothetical protein